MNVGHKFKLCNCMWKNTKKIEEYIRTQLQEDIAEDQISMKEYIDPFVQNKE